MKIEVFTPFYDRDTKMPNLLKEHYWLPHVPEPKTVILFDGEPAAPDDEIAVRWTVGEKTEILLNNEPLPPPVEYWRDDVLRAVVE